MKRYYLHQLETMPEQLPGILGWSDRDMNIIGCNTRLAKSFGFENPQALSGRNQKDLPCGEYVETFKRDDDFVCQEEKDCLFLECTCFHKGNIIPALAHKFPLYNKNDKVVGVFCLAYLITRESLAGVLSEVSANLALGFQSLRRVEHYDLRIQGIIIKLTNRENEVLFYLMHGFQYRQIAQMLNLSLRSIETYASSLKNKLYCKDRYDLLELVCKNQQLNVIPSRVFETFFKSVKSSNYPAYSQAG